MPGIPEAVFAFPEKGEGGRPPARPGPACSPDEGGGGGSSPAYPGTMPNLKPLSPHQLRGTRPVARAVSEYTLEARARGEHCWLCGQAIDWTLKDAKDTSHDGYPEVDHVLPVSKFPQHAADKANMRMSHKGCNRKRSNSMTSSGVGHNSTDWEALGAD